MTKHTKLVQVFVAPKVLKRLQRLKKSKGVTMATLVRQAINRAYPR